MSHKNTISKNNDTSKFGSVKKLEDGRSYVLFERHLPYSVEKVWAALTEPEQVAKWFPGFKPELKEGGRYQIWFSGEHCEGPSHINGIVTQYKPLQIFECEGSMRFDLEADGSECVLRLTSILDFDDNRSRAEFTNSVMGGWHRYFDALEATLVGTQFDHSKPEFDYATIDVPGRD